MGVNCRWEDAERRCPGRTTVRWACHTDFCPSWCGKDFFFGVTTPPIPLLTPQTLSVEKVRKFKQMSELDIRLTNWETGPDNLVWTCPFSSFFLGWRIPNVITGQRGGEHPTNHVGPKNLSQKPVMSNPPRIRVHQKLRIARELWLDSLGQGTMSQDTEAAWASGNPLRYNTPRSALPVSALVSRDTTRKRASESHGL